MSHVCLAPSYAGARGWTASPPGEMLVVTMSGDAVHIDLTSPGGALVGQVPIDGRLLHLESRRAARTGIW